MGDVAGVEFAAWYREEHRRLVAALLLVTGDIHVAEDAADEAFARAYAHWPRVSQMASPRGWTYRVALNVVRRRWRRAELERRLLARQPPPSTVPAPAGEAWEAVRRLPARQRTAVVLRFLADLTDEQVGIAMGVSRSTISSSLADARRALGRMLAEPAVVDSGDEARQPRRSAGHRGGCLSGGHHVGSGLRRGSGDAMAVGAG